VEHLQLALLSQNSLQRFVNILVLVLI
jgi:hypothetical protein